MANIPVTDLAELVGSYQIGRAQGDLYFKPGSQSFWMEQDHIYLVLVPEMYQGALKKMYQEEGK